MFATAPLIALAIALGLLVAMTMLGVSRIEAAHPPAGRFIEVGGVRLHVAELGLASGSPGAEPAVVLIHGASGNMEDMRLALGEKLAASHRVILIDRPGHGWSSRPPGDSYASPACQAKLVAEALDQLGVRRAIIVGHSWGGAFATAYALAFPERTAGLVLLSAVTHPWPASPGWYNNLASLRGIGPLFLRTLVYPLGSFMIEGVSRGVFEPQPVPPDYLRRAAIRLVLRPKTFFANARDLALLRNFLTAQVSSYADLRTPTIIISGDRDSMVSPQINACALAATVPGAKLVFLKGVGHMPHHAAPEAVAAAIDELIPAQGRAQRGLQRSAVAAWPGGAPALLAGQGPSQVSKPDETQDHVGKHGEPSRQGKRMEVAALRLSHSAPWQPPPR
jgi:pimeloyl-ACP methyl ester carboxylesterase